jgi:hypothetical protein
MSVANTLAYKNTAKEEGHPQIAFKILAVLSSTCQCNLISKSFIVASPGACTTNLLTGVIHSVVIKLVGLPLSSPYLLILLSSGIILDSTKYSTWGLYYKTLRIRNLHIIY